MRVEGDPAAADLRAGPDGDARVAARGHVDRRDPGEVEDGRRERDRPGRPRPGAGRQQLAAGADNNGLGVEDDVAGGGTGGAAGGVHGGWADVDGPGVDGHAPAVGGDVAVNCDGVLAQEAVGPGPGQLDREAAGDGRGPWAGRDVERRVHGHAVGEEAAEDRHVAADGRRGVEPHGLPGPEAAVDRQAAVVDGELAAEDDFAAPGRAIEREAAAGQRQVARDDQPVGEAAAADRERAGQRERGAGRADGQRVAAQAAHLDRQGVRGLRQDEGVRGVAGVDQEQVGAGVRGQRQVITDERVAGEGHVAGVGEVAEVEPAEVQVGVGDRPRAQRDDPGRRAGRGEGDAAGAVVDQEPVAVAEDVAAGPAAAAVEGAVESAGRPEHEGVVVAAAGQVLEACKSDRPHGAGVRDGEAPGVVARRPGEGVPAAAADNTADAADAAGGRRRAGLQVNRDRGRVGRVVQGVQAAPAGDRAGERPAGGEREQVGVHAAGEALDAGEPHEARAVQVALADPGDVPGVGGVRADQPVGAGPGVEDDPARHGQDRSVDGQVGVEAAPDDQHAGGEVCQQLRGVHGGGVGGVHDAQLRPRPQERQRRVGDGLVDEAGGRQSPVLQVLDGDAAAGRVVADGAGRAAVEEFADPGARGHRKTPPRTGTKSRAVDARGLRAGPPRSRGPTWAARRATRFEVTVREKGERPLIEWAKWCRPRDGGGARPGGYFAATPFQNSATGLSLTASRSGNERTNSAHSGR